MSINSRSTVIATNFCMVKMYNRPIYHSSQTNVHPYSLEEYLSAAGVTLQKHWQLSRQQAQVAKHFDDYFHFGGFPELVNVTAKRAWLTGIEWHSQCFEYFPVNLCGLCFWSIP